MRGAEGAAELPVLLWGQTGSRALGALGALGACNGAGHGGLCGSHPAWAVLCSSPSHLSGSVLLPSHLGPSLMGSIPHG